MTLLDVSITNVALPSISDATGAGPVAAPVDRQRLHAGLRAGAGARGTARRRPRTQADVPDRRRRLRGHQRARRARADRRGADRRARAPGHLRRPDQPAGLRAGPADVPRRGAGPRLRCARHDRRPRHRPGPAGRRRADRARAAPTSAGGWCSSSTCPSGWSSSRSPGASCRRRPATRPAPARRPRLADARARPRSACSFAAVEYEQVRRGVLLLALPAVAAAGCCSTGASAG